MGVLQREVARAAEIIKRHDYARVVSHYDVDGITSAGIICNALIRRGIPFHATIVSRLDRRLIQGMRDEELIIIADMGTAQLEMLMELLGLGDAEMDTDGDRGGGGGGDRGGSRDVIIIDHHAVSSSAASSSGSVVLINPYWLSERKQNGEVVGGELCAAGISYLVARLLGTEESAERGNVDLAGLAIAGTIGDKLPLERGINQLILEEGIREGVVTPREGLKLGGGKIRDLILFSTDPYLPLAGKVEWVDAFLKERGIDGDKRLEELDREEERRLCSALLSIASESATKLSKEALFGRTYMLNLEVVKNALDFTRMVDACGRFGKAGIGIGLCLRESRLVEEARSLYQVFQTKLVSELNRIESAKVHGDGRGKGDGVKELTNIYYLYVQEKGITGVLAGIIAEYINTSKPVIVLNRKNGVNEQVQGGTKISARCSRELLDEGIDLAKALEQASREAGGYGGGHPVASGASIPEGMEERFITAVDRIIGEQIRAHTHRLSSQ